MSIYYVYHCSISEISVDSGEVNSILEAHTEDSKIHTNKQEAISELRDILDKHSATSLIKEVERLNRVIAVLDRKVSNAVTVPV